MRTVKKIFIATAAIVLAAMAAPAFAATNPFMDVPASHWAYDAVAQLASRGVVSGYPDGTYKGPQPATRYEIASIIARALAYIDMEKAGRQDVELMRRLIVEFNDELLALGVRVDGLDARLGAIERDLGGWRISGELEFYANFGKRENSGEIVGRNDFELDKYRVFIDKRINETTSFHARLGKGGDALNGNGGGLLGADAPVLWNYFYISTKLGYDVTLDAGSMNLNWEDDAGMSGDDGPFMYDITLNGFRLTKDWGMANIKLFAGRRGDWKGAGHYVLSPDVAPNPALRTRFVTPDSYDWESFLIAGNLDFTFNEHFRGGVLVSHEASDATVAPGSPDRLLTVGVYAGFRFHPSVDLRGIYYHQDAYGPDYNERSAKAWRAVLDIDQNLLKFTSLQFEYAQMDSRGDFNFDNYSYLGLDLFPAWGDGYFGDRLTAYGVWARQQWGESDWDTWLRYYHGDWDQPVGGGKADSVGVGIGYQWNPAVRFELAYSYIKYNFCSTIIRMCDNDRVIRFSTLVTF